MPKPVGLATLLDAALHRRLRQAASERPGTIRAEECAAPEFARPRLPIPV